MRERQRERETEREREKYTHTQRWQVTSLSILIFIGFAEYFYLTEIFSDFFLENILLSSIVSIACMPAYQ